MPWSWSQPGQGSHGLPRQWAHIQRGCEDALCCSETSLGLGATWTSGLQKAVQRVLCRGFPWGWAEASPGFTQTTQQGLRGPTCTLSLQFQQHLGLHRQRPQCSPVGISRCTGRWMNPEPAGSVTPSAGRQGAPKQIASQLRVVPMEELCSVMEGQVTQNWELLFSAATR